MLRLDTQQYLQAAACMARALDKAETEGGFKTFSDRVCAILDALGEEFDIAPMDPGPNAEGLYVLGPDVLEQWIEESQRDDIVSGEVWPEVSSADIEICEEVFHCCAHCESGDHTSEEHRSALSQRLINEIDQYNRGLVNGE